MKWGIWVGLVIGLLLKMMDGDTALAHGLAAIGLKMAVLLLALTFHECAHGAMALALGDSTARDRGRLTLNPMAHFDLTGLVVVPGLLAALGAPVAVGWAQPVPVDFERLRWRRLGMFLVAAAGPVASLAVAVGGMAALRLAGIDGSAGLAASIAWYFVLTNLAIGFFNLLPLYPLDGGRLVASLLPERLFSWLLNNEGKTALAALFVLVVLPWGFQGLGVTLAPLAPVERAFTAASDWATGGSAWSKPLESWMKRS